MIHHCYDQNAVVNTKWKQLNKLQSNGLRKFDEMWISNLITTVTSQPYPMYNGRRKMMGTTTVHLNFAVEEMDNLDALDRHSSIISHLGHETNVSVFRGK